MKISVITVAFNSAATIGDTLRSVAAQSHRDIEHIVIDGASSDNTLAQVQEHGRHVAHVVSEPDAGIYDAMNKGLMLATGEFVGFLNADDMLADEDAIRRVAEAAEAGTPADAIYGDLLYVTPEHPHHTVRRWRSGAFSPERLRSGWMPPHPAFYVRRELVREFGGFAVDLRIAADYDLMLRYLMLPGIRVRYVPRVMVHMRTGGASNRSMRALIAKSKEDHLVMQRNGIGGWFTLLCKNLRKLPQFL